MRFNQLVTRNRKKGRVEQPITEHLRILRVQALRE
jgi:hypothetical protein